MTARALSILVAVTVAMVVAAAVALWRAAPPPAAAGKGERVFPALLERIDKLSAITVRTQGGQLTIRRQGQGWVLAERNGYPVPFEKVKETVLGLAALEKVEPKTTRADRFARLGVEDVEAAGSTSRELSLLDSQDQTLARLIVGKPAYGLGGEGALYVRIPGEEQAWAVKGSLPAGSTPRDWIERTVIDIPADSVSEVRITHADGQKLVVSRSAESGTLLLAGLPAGARVKRQDDLDSIAGALAGLSLEDVSPAAAIDFAKGKTVRATFVTGDGLNVGIEMLAADDQRWIRITAQAVNQAADTRAVERANALSARTRDWAYRIPNWKLTSLQRQLADLIEKPQPGS